jgi:protein-L-isoaspartate(D-aspartate) O-methyltransferase
VKSGDAGDGFAAQRARMVREQLAAREIRDEAVLAAMGWVPRHEFVLEAQRSRAYDDCALPAEFGQTISQPYIVARMTQALRLTRESRVLEIGAGTGYQTAVLARIVRHVWSIEWHLGLMTAAHERLARLGISNVTLRCADGGLGWPEFAPYDAILVAAGAQHAPPALLTQLAEGGRLVIPLGERDEQELRLFTKHGADIRGETLLQCRFVRLVGAAGWRD